jgi:hypothetical protein
MSGNSKGEPNAKNQPESDRFTNFVRRLMAVPHSEVKAAMEADKQKKRVASSSRVSGASSRER